MNQKQNFILNAFLVGIVGLIISIIFRVIAKMCQNGKYNRSANKLKTEI